MSTIRFTLIAVVLFGLTFAGISWANRGFPVIAMRGDAARPVAQAAQPPAVEDKKSVQAKTVDPVPTFEESVKKGVRKDWENSKTAQGDGDPKREALRLAALQAANAFALSPCDATMKKNLVEALSAYAKAWSDMAGCKFFMCSGDGRRVDTAATSFSTPSDMRVREAVRSAFEKGGISREDFPGSIRLWVTMLAGDPGDPASACSTGRQADRRR